MQDLEVRNMKEAIPLKVQRLEETICKTMQEGNLKESGIHMMQLVNILLKQHNEDAKWIGRKLLSICRHCSDDSSQYSRHFWQALFKKIWNATSEEPRRFHSLQMDLMLSLECKNV